MPITLSCPKCHKPFRVRDESIGMRVKCPTCAAVLQVPADLSAASPSNEGSTRPPRSSPPQRGAGHAVPSKTAKAGGVAESSFLDELREPSRHSGPPSLPPIPETQQLQHREDRVGRGGWTSATGPLPPVPSARRTGSGKMMSSRMLASDVEPGQIVEDAIGWRKVRKGLRWIQIGLILAFLPGIAHFAVAAYCLQEHVKVPDNFFMSDVKLVDGAKLANTAGYLDKKNLTFWKELEVVYAFAIPLLAYVCVLFGLASCMSIPDAAKTRGVAGGAFFLTLLAFGALAVHAVSLVGPFFGFTSLPHEAKSISWTLFVFLVLVSQGWFFIYIAQAGVPLRSVKSLRDTAMTFLLIGVIVAGALIANDIFHPIFVADKKVTLDNLVETYLIQAGILLTINILFVLNFLSVAGIIRKAIARWMDENSDTLEAVPE